MVFVREMRRLLPLAALLALAAPPRARADDEGATLFSEICGSCHSAKTNPLDGKHLTLAQWKEAIERMEGLGAEIPEKKVPVLLDYLVRTRGPAAAAPPAEAPPATR